MKIAGLHLDNPLTNPLDPEPEEPIGLEYVLSSIKDIGHYVKLFLLWDKDEEIVRDILAFSPDSIFIEIYTKDFLKAIRIAERIKDKNKNIKIVVGGCHPTAFPREVLEESNGLFDFAVIGEGERTAVELVDCIKNKGLFDKVKGISYWCNGSVKVNKRRPLIKNINNISWPIREPSFYDLPSNCLYYPENSRLRYSSLIHSRGCPNHCLFCASGNMWGHKPRYRSPSDVVNEMNYLHETFGVNLIFIEDLSINIDTSELLKLCDEMIDHLHPDVHWATCANIGLSKKLLLTMKEVHCVCVSYGVESLDPNSLKAAHKKQTLAQIEETLVNTAKCGIINYVFYMIGFENEDEESIIKTSNKLMKLPIHRLRVTIATPLPGSQWYNEIDKNRLDKDWSKYDTIHPVILDLKIKPDRLLELSNEVTRKFYESNDYANNTRAFIKNFPMYKKSFNEFLSYMNVNI